MWLFDLFRKKKEVQVIERAAPSGNPALSAMSGMGGDYFISALTTATSGLLFSHLYITADATVTEINIGDVSVSDTGAKTLSNVSNIKTARHYNSTLPAGYLICAGANKAIRHDVVLATGSAQGVILYI